MHNLISIHGHILGVVTIAAWFVVMVLSGSLRIFASNSDAPWFWRVVSFAQIMYAVQLLAGTFLFLRGGLPGPTSFEHVFHPLYGVVFPFIVLVVGHKMARDETAHPFTVFAVVGLTNAALAIRAYMVALQVTS